MKPRLKSILQYSVLFGLVVFLMWWMLQGIADKKEEIFRAFREANYLWVFLSLTAAFVSHFIRAYRWKYMLEPLGFQPKIGNSLKAVFIGYFANYLVPRMGEVSRCSIISREEKVPFQKALGTVVTERIVDMLLLLLVFVLTLLFQFNELIGLTRKYILLPLQTKLGGLTEKPLFLLVLAVLFVSVIAVVFIFRKKIQALLSGKFGNLIKGFGEGISSVGKMNSPGAFILQSVLIWVMYLLGIYFCFFALRETAVLGLSEGLTILLFGTFGVIFTPGGLGAYHLIVMQILLYYGIAEAVGFAFAWLVWGSQFILIVFLGLISLFFLGIGKKQEHAAT